MELCFCRQDSLSVGWIHIPSEKAPAPTQRFCLLLSHDGSITDPQKSVRLDRGAIQFCSVQFNVFP